MSVEENHLLSIVSTNAINNTAVIRYVVECRCTGESYNNYDQTGTFTIDGQEYQNTYRLPSNATTTVFSKDVTIINASGRSITASYSFPTTPSGGIKTGTTNINIPNLTKAPIIKYLRLKKRTVDSLTFEFECDGADVFYYKVSTGSSYTKGKENVTKGEFTVNNLTPNETYSISFIARNWINEAEDKYMQTVQDIEGMTFDIAKISSLSNFEHGNSVNFRITNPSNSNVSIEMKVENTKILSKTVSEGNNTINFNDSQLDIMYKLYKNQNSLIANFTITTNNKYTNSKNCTITLKGNQKTIKTNINNNWKRGKIYINVNNTWKKAVVWINVNGTWRRCI